jgi:hypothetical protein
MPRPRRPPPRRAHAPHERNGPAGERVHKRLASDLLLGQHRCIESAKPRAAIRSEAETAIYRPQLAVFGIQKVGRERTVSRVLYPLRDGDHLSGAPVARRL